MKIERILIDTIPAMVWGEPSDSVYIFVHGKQSNKEEAERLAKLTQEKGIQVISFDLPEHGERTNEPRNCSVQNGVEDLLSVLRYVETRWSHYYLFAISLGAYFCLLAYQNAALKKCLFVSPILDMRVLIENMMKWFQVDEMELEKKGEIETPIGETLIWDYYQYVKQHPINTWKAKTHILYGDHDGLTSKEVVEKFQTAFNCEVTVIENGEHYFQTAEQLTILDEWMKLNF